jgi:hypothetical protein
MSILTVISSSALTRLAKAKEGNKGVNLQYLKEMVSLLVCLCQQTQRESRNCIMTPRTEESHEKCLAILDEVSYQS